MKERHGKKLLLFSLILFSAVSFHPSSLWGKSFFSFFHREEKAKAQKQNRLTLLPSIAQKQNRKKIISDSVSLSMLLPWAKQIRNSLGLRHFRILQKSKRFFFVSGGREDGVQRGDTVVFYRLEKLMEPLSGKMRYGKKKNFLGVGKVLFPFSSFSKIIALQENTAILPGDEVSYPSLPKRGVTVEVLSEPEPMLRSFFLPSPRRNSFSNPFTPSQLRDWLIQNLKKNGYTAFEKTDTDSSRHIISRIQIRILGHRPLSYLLTKIFQTDKHKTLKNVFFYSLPSTHFQSEALPFPPFPPIPLRIAVIGNPADSQSAFYELTRQWGDPTPTLLAHTGGLNFYPYFLPIPHPFLASNSSNDSQSLPSLPPTAENLSSNIPLSEDSAIWWFSPLPKIFQSDKKQLKDEMLSEKIVQSWRQRKDSSLYPPTLLAFPWLSSESEENSIFDTSVDIVPFEPDILSFRSPYRSDTKEIYPEPILKKETPISAIQMTVLPPRQSVPWELSSLPLSSDKKLFYDWNFNPSRHNAILTKKNYHSISNDTIPPVFQIRYYQDAGEATEAFLLGEVDAIKLPDKNFLDFKVRSDVDIIPFYRRKLVYIVFPPSFVFPTAASRRKLYQSLPFRTLNTIFLNHRGRKTKSFVPENVFGENPYQMDRRFLRAHPLSGRPVRFYKKEQDIDLDIILSQWIAVLKENGIDAEEVRKKEEANVEIGTYTYHSFLPEEGIVFLSSILRRPKPAFHLMNSMTKRIQSSKRQEASLRNDDRAFPLFYLNEYLALSPPASRYVQLLLHPRAFKRENSKKKEDLFSPKETP